MRDQFRNARNTTAAFDSSPSRRKSACAKQCTQTASSAGDRSGNGLRRGSQYGLTWDMVDWKSRLLNIPRTKNGEAVHVPLNDAALAALKTVFERSDGRGGYSDQVRLVNHSKIRGTGLMTRLRN